MGTQWRHGFAGRTGLDHSVLMRHLDRMRLDPCEWDAMFDDVRALEVEALRTMNESKD